MDATDIALAAALYALPAVRDVYRLIPSDSRYPRFEYLDAFRWAVVLHPYARFLCEAEQTAERIVGRGRMCWIAFLDGDQPIALRGIRLDVPAAPSVATSPPSMSFATVLLVAESPRFVARTKALLRARPGTHLEHVQRADAARRLLTSHAFELVLVVGAMRGLHAVTVCEVIASHHREALPRTRVVIGEAGDAVSHRAAALGIPQWTSLDAAALHRFFEGD